MTIYSHLTIYCLLLATIACSEIRQSDPNVDMAEIKAKGVLKPCSKAWMAFVEERLISGDGQGHGPDIGSAEWQSVIEFKLKVRGNKDVPKRNSVAWCNYVDGKIKTMDKG